MYTLTIFLSAALLFGIQPMVGKMVLPLLGGTPNVWLVCMLFFQALLLGGYAYAHLTTIWLGTRRQAPVHLGIACLTLAALPLTLPGWPPPTEAMPAFWLLGVLLLMVGAPFFVVATTAPLLQQWFASTAHQDAGDPYVLYAASNAGSLLALVSYPLVIEPFLPLPWQTQLWSVGYGLLIGLLACCALHLRRSAPIGPAPTRVEGRASAWACPSDARNSCLPWRRRLRWVGLAFVPSSWMLGLTTYLSTDLAPRPLLWVLPLTTYLLTFILTFARRPPIPQRLMLRLFPFALMGLGVSSIFPRSWSLLGLHVAVFFTGSMVMHGELARDRPAPTYLTAYYLWLAVGGALGGVLNALAAPLLFPWPLEYPLTVIAAGLLLPALLHHGPDSRERWLALLGFALVGGVVVWLGRALVFSASVALVYMTLGGIVLLVLAYLHQWPTVFVAVLGILLMARQAEPPQPGATVHVARTFFGVHRVLRDLAGRHALFHGGTLHGLQNWQAGTDPCEPLAYFTRTGPIGEVFAQFHGQRVGVIGLGTGAMIAYQRPQVTFTFFELDPTVAAIARNPQFFTFLTDCHQDTYRIIIGDGRQRLATVPDGYFDLIIMDAFSSDAVPVHLLTREAFAVYLAKLAPGGLLVFQISNIFFDFVPVLAANAVDAGLVGRLRHDHALSLAEAQRGKFSSRYAVLARQDADLAGLPAAHWRPLAPQAHRSLWTDDLSSPLVILHWPGQTLP